jgi:hypothetical protein
MKFDSLCNNIITDSCSIHEKKETVNPWAVAKSISKKKGYGPKKEEEIVKGIKKSIKKKK